MSSTHIYGDMLLTIFLFRSQWEEHKYTGSRMALSQRNSTDVRNITTNLYYQPYSTARGGFKQHR